MQDKIQKLYELAVKSKKLNWDTMEFELPPFTESKQLELIKWLATNWGSFALYKNEDGFLCGCHSFSSCFCEKPEEALAGLACELWEGLTPKQKEEIKEILG